MHTHTEPCCCLCSYVGGGGFTDFWWVSLHFHVCFTLIHYRHSRHFFSPERMACSLWTTPPPTHTYTPHSSAPQPLCPSRLFPSPPLPLPDLSLTHISISLMMNIKTVSVNLNPSISILWQPFLIHTDTHVALWAGGVGGSHGQRPPQPIRGFSANTMEQKEEIEP